MHDSVNTSGNASITQPSQNPSLRDQAFDTLIDQILHGEEIDPRSLKEVQTLPDFVTKFGAKLYSKASEVRFTEFLLELLSQYLRTQTVVDLTPFKKSLSSDQAMSLTVRIATTGSARKRLDISNLELSQYDLESILNQKEVWDAIFLSSIHPLSLQDVQAMNLDFDLYTEETLNWAFGYPEEDLNARVSVQRGPSQPLRVGLSGRGTRLFANITYLFLPNAWLMNYRAYDTNDRLGFDSMSLNLKTPRRWFTTGGGNEQNPSCLVVPLNGISLPVTRAVAGMQQLLCW